ncbi:hypothetical protein CFI00_05600 [Nocardioides sp. S5]|uniref:hypothetical protein n=1 Tax=Nocardioides sp. S5 TaxID=2017486 RepID=UPI001A8F72CB|nr:hypothetical protein [Nocardioides sp. S5]QSR29993.1 hypothetical protein CFI00_05600 [Nocardioides sp. S5]
MSDRESWVQPHRRPPPARFDYALLKAAGDRTEADAIALLSDAVQQGLTTAERLVEVLDDCPACLGGRCCARSSTTSAPAPGQCSSSATCATSSGPTSP